MFEQRGLKKGDVIHCHDVFEQAELVSEMKKQGIKYDIIVEAKNKRYDLVLRSDWTAEESEDKEWQ